MIYLGYMTCPNAPPTPSATRAHSSFLTTTTAVLRESQLELASCKLLLYTEPIYYTQQSELDCNRKPKYRKQYKASFTASFRLFPPFSHQVWILRISRYWNLCSINIPTAQLLPPNQEVHPVYGIPLYVGSDIADTMFHRSLPSLLLSLTHSF